MSWCTAVHAEVSAVLAAGERARGGTLYATTFPCFQCAEKITQVGIKTVYYSEAYPDPHSGKRLELSRIELRQFEGLDPQASSDFFSGPARRSFFYDQELTTSTLSPLPCIQTLVWAPEAEPLYSRRILMKKWETLFSILMAQFPLQIGTG